MHAPDGTHPSLQQLFDADAGAVPDPLPARIAGLLERAGRLRAEAAALTGIADRAEASARRLRAYRHATDVFVGDPAALDLLARLAEHWTGDGEQLVAAVVAVQREIAERSAPRSAASSRRVRPCGR